MTERYTQTLPKTATFVAGVVVFTVGGITAFLCVWLGVAFARNGRALHTAESWVVALMVGLFGLFAAVLCTAGYRLLFRSPAGAGSMLPRSLWLVLCIFLGALAIFGLVAPLVLKQFYAPMLYSSIMMGAFSWWCYRFGRRHGNDGRRGAAPNNRWSGP